MKEAIDKWIRVYQSGPWRLTLHRGPGFSIIRDFRDPENPREYILGKNETMIYLSCDSGANVDAIVKKLGDAGETAILAADVAKFLREGVQCRLLYEESGAYLSLAVPVR